MNSRLDQEIVNRGLTPTRSQAETYIKLGFVRVNGSVISQPSKKVLATDQIKLNHTQYVSRAGLKLESVAEKLELNFKDKTVLDVGSSTGGFTDFALKHGATYVIAVEVGTDQLHPSLAGDKRIELHEKTDIRDVKKLSKPVDLVLIDVSFISLRGVLPSVAKLISPSAKIAAMFKPQFEAAGEFRHKGVVKNDKVRRQLIANFEQWLKNNNFVVLNKADSKISGEKGNVERFYLLKTLR